MKGDPNHSSLYCKDNRWMVWILKHLDVSRDVLLYIWRNYLHGHFHATTLFCNCRWTLASGGFSNGNKWTMDRIPHLDPYPKDRFMMVRHRSK